MKAFVAWLLMASVALAQDFSGLARVDPLESSITSRRDELTISLSLTQAIPYRVFTLTDPDRLVVDFREVDWTGLTSADLLETDQVIDLRFGRYRPGWSRMVVDLTQPMGLVSAEMDVDDQTGRAALELQFTAVDAETFAASAGAPDDPRWQEVTIPAPATDDGPPVIVIDPGHGGLDPGAERGGVVEADLMLSLAIELSDRLNRSGNVRAVLTRTDDYFVPLDRRITYARDAGADLLISLHADALEEANAHGASVYTLTQEGLDGASQRMAERHERGDLLAGVDLSGQGDRVATVLMDLARAETAPATDRFAAHAVQGLRDAGARLNSRPLRQGRLAVLTAADFASVLIEVGFLSSERDRGQLSTAAGRAPIVSGLALAVERWVVDEAAAKALVRQ